MSVRPRRAVRPGPLAASAARLAPLAAAWAARLAPAAAAWACLACGTSLAWQLGFGGGAEFTVTRSTERGPYLDAQLSGPSFPLRVFAPPSASCRYVLEPEATVVFHERAPAGSFERRDARCVAVGFGETRIGRARRPRGEGAEPIPRAQARFEILFEDAEVVMLRGDFPLAGRVGWATPYDVVAVVPNTPVCRTPIERGVASLEYRPSRDLPLSLVGRADLCPIVGLARPPGAP